VQSGKTVPGFGALTPEQKRRRQASDALTSQGFSEIVGWSFTCGEAAEKLRLDGHSVVELQNPMSSDQSRLRTTLLSSLLDVLALNRSRGAGNLRLFEAGAVYRPRGADELPHEPYHVAALISGEASPNGWRSKNPQPADFFTAKSALQGLLETIR